VSDALSGEPERELDPFSGHERFADQLGGGRRTARARPEELRPLEPLDVSIDKLVDLEALEQRASFEGMVRSPRTLDEDDLDPKISDALTECKPQFHLRNLSRAERFADPEQPLDFESTESSIGLPEPDDDAPDPMARVRPDLLPSFSSQTVRGLRADHRQLFEETAWNEHFSREIKEDADGPLWKPAETRVKTEDAP
jgi:hypothetical protein